MMLQGKVAIITGAASGMGRAMCLRFAQEGAGVAAVDVDRKGAEAVAKQVHEAGGEAMPFTCDVSQRDQVREAVAATVRRFGKLHVLVNNAGIYLKDDYLLEDLTEETWDKVMGVNLKGAFYFCRFAIPEIITCGGGAVVNIASTAALAGVDHPAYAASKGALLNMTRAVARQYAADNIRANVICPGSTDTAMSRNAATFRQEATIPFPRMTSWMLPRAARPEEIASVAAFLASEEASYITAAVYPVDGGLTAI